jgi:hypothetical protein
MRERDSREEDKEEGRGLGKGCFLWGKFWKKEKRRRRRLEGKDCFWGTFTGHCCCWEIWARGPGNHKDSWS